MNRLHIPHDWSPEQARAVAEFLQDILDDVWAIHGYTLQHGADLRADPDFAPDTDESETSTVTASEHPPGGSVSDVSR